VGRDVARRARVGVVAPGSADLAAPLDDDEVALAGLGQLDGRAEPGEAAAGDEDLDVTQFRGGHAITLRAN